MARTSTTRITASIIAVMSLILAMAGQIGRSALPAGAAESAITQADKTDRYKEKAQKVKEAKEKKVDQADRDAAAARALQEGALNPLMMVGAEAMAAAAAVPGEAPRYFSHPNYANSPLPTVSTVAGAETFHGNTLQDRQYATDSAANVFVVLDGAPYPPGC